MTTSNDLTGLVGEHDIEVPLSARSGFDDGDEDRGGPLDGQVVVRRQRGNRYLIGGRVVVEVTLHRHVPPRGRPIWTACATMETSREPLQWSHTVSEQSVARRMARQHGVVGFDLGQVFNDLGHTIEQGAQALARTGVLNNVVRDVRGALNSPAAQTVLNAASFVPGLGQAVQGFRAATTLVDNVMNGDARSRANLAQLHGAAQQGHQAAQQAVRVVEDVLAGQRAMANARAAAQQPRPPTGLPPRPSRPFMSYAARPRVPSPAEDRAWRDANARWAEWRAARASEGAADVEPLIPPPPVR